MLAGHRGRPHPAAPVRPGSPPEPAVIYDTQAGKFDKSFQKPCSATASKSTTRTKASRSRFEPQNEAQREQGLRRLASRQRPHRRRRLQHGFRCRKSPPSSRNTQFTIIDMVVDKPNVQSVIFKEHEGSFLVGALAAMASKTGKIGVVGGMDILLIRKFQCGYEQGQEHQSKIRRLQNATGSTPAAFADPAGCRTGQVPVRQSADVVLCGAAGGTGIGVYQAARTKASWPSVDSKSRTTRNRAPC